MLVNNLTLWRILVMQNTDIIEENNQHNFTLAAHLAYFLPSGRGQEVDFLSVITVQLNLFYYFQVFHSFLHSEANTIPHTNGFSLYQHSWDVLDLLPNLHQISRNIFFIFSNFRDSQASVISHEIKHTSCRFMYSGWKRPGYLSRRLFDLFWKYI